MVNFLVLIKTVILLLLITLPSCKNKQESVLVIADIIKVEKESTSAAILNSHAIIEDLLYNNLSYMDSDHVFQNLLAEEVKTFPGEKSIEIRIKKGIRFHDGREMTADDVAASFNERMEKDKYAKERFETIRMEVVDRSRVTLKGVETKSDINILLCNSNVFSRDFAGTGPYKVQRWIDNGVELTANNDYFEGTPKLKKVVYRYEPDERKRVRMLLSGEADLLVWLSPEMAEFLKRDGRFYVNEKSSYIYSAIFLNNESPLFRDKAVRRAVSMAIDRDGLIKTVLKGGGIKRSTPLPPWISDPEKDKTGVDYRPREAARLLKSAGWSDADGDGILEKNGAKLRFRLYYNKEAEEFRKLADLIAQDLFELGIGVETLPTTIRGLSGGILASGNYDAILDTKSSEDSVNRLVWRSSSLYNVSGFKSREMDTLLDQLSEATYAGQMKEIYSKMQRIFEEEVPAVTLYYPIIFTAVSKRFKGAEDFIGDVYSVYRIKDWSIDESFR